MKTLTHRIRSVAGVAGALAAVAGGVGAAVGLYTLPDPAAQTVTAHVYERADQRAIAVWREEQPDGGYIRLYVELARGASASAEHPVYQPYVAPVAYFSSHREACNEAGECEPLGGWYTEIPLDAFDFDPLLGRARFTGTVDGCAFDVEWTGTGEAAPFAGYQGSAGSDWFPDLRLDRGYAEVSRVAPATIDSCFTSLDDVPGFLSQGLRDSSDHLHVYEPEK